MILRINLEKLIKCALKYQYIMGSNVEKLCTTVRADVRTNTRTIASTNGRTHIHKYSLTHSPSLTQIHIHTQTLSLSLFRTLMEMTTTAVY